MITKGPEKRTWFNTAKAEVAFCKFKGIVFVFCWCWFPLYTHWGSQTFKRVLVRSLATAELTETAVGTPNKE